MYTGISLGPRLPSFFGGRKSWDETTLECQHSKKLCYVTCKLFRKDMQKNYPDFWLLHVHTCTVCRSMEMLKPYNRNDCVAPGIAGSCTVSRSQCVVETNGFTYTAVVIVSSRIDLSPTCVYRQLDSTYSSGWNHLEWLYLFVEGVFLWRQWVDEEIDVLGCPGDQVGEQSHVLYTGRGVRVVVNLHVFYQAFTTPLRH